MRRLLAALLACILAASAAHAFVGPRRSLLTAHKATPVAPSPWVLPGAVGQVNMFNSPQNWADTTNYLYINIADTTFATKIQAPDGTLSGSKWIANATNASHAVTTLAGVSSIKKVARSMTYKVVCIVKAGEYSRYTIDLQTITGSAGSFATYDLAAGQVVGGAATGVFGAGWVNVGTEVVDVTGGWWRLGMTFTTDAAGSIQMSNNIDNGVGQAARSFSFAGNGVNGLYVQKCNMLPAAAWNHTALVFDATFTPTTNLASILDLGNTKAAGFPWYLGGPWPASTDYTGQAWRTAKQEVAACCAITADGLSITGLVAAGEVGQELSTTAYTSGSGYVGRVFTPGGLYCASMKFNPASMASGQVMWPSAGWGISQEFLTGAAPEFIELDNYEASPSGTGTYANAMSSFDWLITGLTLSNNHFFFSPTIANNDNAPHRYCTLWITAAENGGVGYRQRYFDNTYLGSGDLTYSAAAGSVPASAPGNPAGQFFTMEGHHFPIFLSSWQGIASYYQYVRYWQAGSSGGLSSNLLLVDGASKLLLFDNSSKLCLAGGC